MPVPCLPEIFPDVYSQFFYRNTLVASGHVPLPLFSDALENRPDRFCLRLKTPFRCFVGLSFCQKEGEVVSYGDIHIYRAEENTFITKPFPEIFARWKKIEPELKKIITEMGFEKCVTISAIIEVERGHGFGFVGSLFSCLMTALLAAKDGTVASQISTENFRDNPLFQKIISLCLQAECTAHSQNYIAASARSALLQSSFSVHLLGKDGAISHEICKENEALPFDIYLIYSGSSIETHTIQRGQIGRKQELIDEAVRVGEHLFANLDITKETGSLETLQKSISEIGCVLELNMIGKFQRLIERGYSGAAFELFRDAVEEYRKSLEIFEWDSEFITILQSLIREEKNNTAISPCFSARFGGGFILFTSPGVFRRKIHTLLEKLRAFGYPNASLDYMSSESSLPTGGVQIIHDIENKKISPLCKVSGVVAVREVSGKITLESYQDVFIKRPTSLVLDQISNKIFIGNMRCSSADIPSQSAAIEILWKLLRAEGRPISNGELSLSAYSKSKAEIYGKILTPLDVLCKKNFGKDLGIVCQGSRTRFTIHLPRENMIQISLIEPAAFSGLWK